MSLKLILIFLLTSSLSSYGQSKLLLKNTQTNRQKEITRNDFIKISFSTIYEKVKVYHVGKVLSFTDSTLSYMPTAYIVPLSWQKDTITIGLKNILAIQKYKPVVSLALVAGAGVAVGIAGEELAKDAPSSILIVAGALIIVRAVETFVVYPMRKVNQMDSVWQLSVSP